MNQEQSLPESESLALDVGFRDISRARTATDEESLASGQQDTEEDHGIKFKDWGFKIDRLFEVAHRFYKRNESKAFHPSFDIRNQMNALILQARYGNFDDGKAPDIGTLDLVGKSRRHQWSLLKGMSKAEAMSKFICTLDEICPLFKAHAEAIKISSGIQLNILGEENGREQSNSEKQNQADSDEQFKAIHTSLCRQTYDQFKNYAEKQYPNDLPKQKYLVTSLQEQYYQQYISKMKPDSIPDHRKKSSLPSPTISESSSTDINQLNNSSSSPDANEVQSSASIAQPLSDYSHTSTEETLDILDSSQPNHNKSHKGEQLLNNSQMVGSDSILKQEDPNKSHLVNLRQISLAQSNASSVTNLNSENVVIQCPSIESSPVKQIRTSEAIRPSDRDYDTENLIGQFESYPEPKPIQLATESIQRSAAINLLNYLGDNVANKQHQIKQQPSGTTSLYANSPPDKPVPPSFPSYEPLPPPPSSQQQSIPPPQYEQSSLPNQRISPIRDELGTNHINQSIDIPVVDTWDYDGSSGSSSPLQQTLTTYEPLEPASIWTKKGVNEFRDSLTDDKHEGTYIVKQGTLLTIQVPTYPDGKYIYWEFATDEYDIGFGLDFIYETNLEKPLALKFHEETDDDDDDVEESSINNYDIESATETEAKQSDRDYASTRRQAEKFTRIANTVSIIPTYRRDSHEEVFVGRHRYPGQGYYLLKFDNTYSVLRSKALFFRICYFI